MRKHNKDFYVWTMAEVKSTYEWWGIDMMSMYDHIQKDFPNAAEAIKKMYNNFKTSNFYETKCLSFEKPQFVYEAIANLVPLHEQLYFNTKTKEEADEYKYLNMIPWDEFISIARIDLLMAVLLFTEDFILQPITRQNVVFKDSLLTAYGDEDFILQPMTNQNVVFTDNQLTVYGDFVTLKISKDEKKTYISIRIVNVMLLDYVILN